MRSLNRYLTALLMCLVFCQGLMGAEKREMIEVTEGTDGWYRIMLPKETPADTLFCGAFFAKDENARIFTLINVYNRLKEKKITYESILRMEKESEEAIREYRGTPSEAPMREMLKSSLERAYELYGHPSDYDTQEWSETRLMTIKASISKECGGGKLWAFSSFREPRHGLVAVARKDASGKKKWGFMSMTGRMIVPCIYDDVLDFNNRRYWSNPGFDNRPDEDKRPWTVVRKGDRIGMIDNTGRIMVPIVFGLYQDVERMIFHMTPRGELAAAREPSTKKHGLIDRRGNWVIQPKYEELAWDGKENHFYALTSKYDHGTFMGYDRTVIDISLPDQDIKDLTVTTEIDGVYVFGFNLKESRSAKGGIWNIKTGKPETPLNYSEAIKDSLDGHLAVKLYREVTLGPHPLNGWETWVFENGEWCRADDHRE